MALPFAISFVSAAKELGYGATDEWGPVRPRGRHGAARQLSRPASTHSSPGSPGIGYDTIDLWFAHLNWRWATPEHVAVAREALARHGVRVVAFRRRHREHDRPDMGSANDLNMSLIAGLGGIVHTDRDAAARGCAHGVRFGLGADPRRGACPRSAMPGTGAAVSTGWWATQGYDPVQAPSVSCPTVFHVHLKDVEEPGARFVHARRRAARESASSVDALLELGYSRAVSRSRPRAATRPRMHPDAQRRITQQLDAQAAESSRRQWSAAGTHSSGCVRRSRRVPVPVPGSPAQRTWTGR